MKRILSLAILSLVVLSSPPLRAQESAEIELEFVRKLREKGWIDLTRTKIDQLLKRNDPLLNASLPLELARLNIASARQLGPEQRFALFTTARTQLQEYIAKNQGKASAALATVELARLTSYHAQAILSKAMREEDDRTRHEKARPAEDMFKQASADLEAATKALDAALADPANAALKAALQDELRHTRFDLAVNLFHQARTYIDTFKSDTNAKRADLMEKARKAFDALRNDESSEIGWLAKAWLMKTAMEQTAGDIEISKHYDAIMKRKDEKAAQAGLRMARFFYMQDVAPQRADAEAIGKNTKYSKMTRTARLHAVQKEGESWLKSYPGHVKSYEGQGVLYELGLAYFMEAEEIRSDLKAPKKVDPKKPDPKKPDPKKADPRLAQMDSLYDKAIKHLDDLAALDGDRSESAAQISRSIKFRRLGDKTVLTTFDEFFMKAMIERDKVRIVSSKLEAAKEADKKKLEDERKAHLRDVIKSLQSGLELTTSKTPVARVDEAQFYLTGAYLAYGDPYRAVVIAETVGRHRPPTRRSPEAAAVAIATYSSLASKQPANSSLRQRLHDMAEYVLLPENQRTWSADPVTSMAHYHLAISANRENRPRDAIKHLSQIRPDFNDYIYTQGQLVFIAEAAREKTQNKKDQDFFLQQAKEAIKRMPAPNMKEESGTIVAMYFFAKMEMAKYIYAEAMDELTAKVPNALKAINKCDELSKFVKTLSSEFSQVPGGKLTKENHDQIDFSMQVMLKYADFGIAESQFRGQGESRFDLVVKTTRNVVDQMIAKAKAVPADKAIELKDHRVTGDILGLALRANVQKGNVQEGKAILDVLKRLAAPGQPAGANNAVGPVLSDIAGQIKRMKDEKSDKLEETKKHYIAFLDEVAKTVETGTPDATTALMLGQAYSSLEFPAKAAAAYARVPPPPDLDKQPEKPVIRTPKIVLDPNKPDKKLMEMARAEQEEIARELAAATAKVQKWNEDASRYWNAQIEYVKALRATKDPETQKTAEKAITDLLKHPQAKFKIQAMMERNLLLEDQERYREAYLEWSKKFLPHPALADRANKDVQKIYFEAYLHEVRTMYKTATKDMKLSAATRTALLSAAARKILALEFAATDEGWQIAGPRFEALLNEEADLKKEYEKQKALRTKK